MKNTQEGNKLIVQFMGGNVENTDFYGDFSGCEYDTSWDWLMPVVEKIELLSIDEFYYSFQVYIGKFRSSVMPKDKRNNPVFENETYSELGSKLERTYQVVVEFIEWYNTQSK